MWVVAYPPALMRSVNSGATSGGEGACGGGGGVAIFLDLTFVMPSHSKPYKLCSSFHALLHCLIPC